MNGTALEISTLVSFNHVATHGGIGPASRATGQSKATLSRHVRELEDGIGVRLVERSKRTLRLTEEGAALHARTGTLLTEIEEAANAIVAGSGHLRGRLRVSVPVLFASMAMSRIAADFITRYPKISLEISADDRTVDLVTEGYDVVVRVNPRPDPNLIGRCFLRDQHIVVAPPALPFPSPSLATQGDRTTPAVVLCSSREAPVWRVHRDGSLVEIRPEPVMRVSSLLMIRDVIRAGAGAGVLPRSLVEEDLSAGRLVSWGAASDRSVEVWVLHTSRRLVNAKVDAFVGFLCSAFKPTLGGAEIK